jgi:hypothetical protein
MDSRADRRARVRCNNSVAADVRRVGRVAKALVLAVLCCVVQTRTQPEVPRPHDNDFGSLASLAPVMLLVLQRALWNASGAWPHMGRCPCRCLNHRAPLSTVQLVVKNLA